MPFAQSGNQFRGSLFDFSGGLNNWAKNFQIRENQASNILNMVFDVFGSVRTRPGYDAVNDTPVSNDGVYGIAEYIKSNGDRKFLAAINTRIYELSGVSTWVEIGSGLTASKDVSIVHSLGTAYIANGEEDIKQWDGTTFASIATPPAQPVSYLLPLNNPPRLFAVKGKNAVSTYYWSDAGALGTFDVASVESLPNGDELMGVSVLFGRVILFAKDSIWMIIGTDPSSWELRRVNSAVGLAAPKSIAFVLGELWFASRDGVYALGGVASDSGSAFSFDAIGVRKVSKNIQGTWDDINQSAIEQAAAGAVNNKYEISIPTGASLVNNKTLFCDANIGGPNDHPWSIFDYAFRSFSPFTLGVEPFLYGGAIDVGKVYKLRTGVNDDGSAISWKYETGYLDVNIPEFEKEFNDVFIWTGDSGDWEITFSYALDMQEGKGGNASLNMSSAGLTGWGSDWGVMVWGASRSGIFQKRYFNTLDRGFTPIGDNQFRKRGRYIKFKVEGNTLNQYMTLIGLVPSGEITDKTLL